MSKVQNKFDHTPFLKLFDGIRNAFYEDRYLDGLAKLYNKLIIAVDGSETPIPNLPALREKFGGTGAKASSPIVRMSIAYDGLNDFIIGAAFFLLTVSERSHAKNHIEKIDELINLKEALFIIDRGRASEKLIKFISEKSYYLFCLRSKFNIEIDALPIGSHDTICDGIKLLTVVLLYNISGHISISGNYSEVHRDYRTYSRNYAQAYQAYRENCGSHSRQIERTQGTAD